jgi:NADH:ubiquinone oxidoreductase subunit 4 (subunit M)
MREKMMIFPLLILIVWMGMYSGHFLRPMDAAVTRLLHQTDKQNLEFALNPK